MVNYSNEMIMHLEKEREIENMLTISFVLSSNLCCRRIGVLSLRPVTDFYNTYLQIYTRYTNKYYMDITSLRYLCILKRLKSYS